MDQSEGKFRSDILGALRATINNFENAIEQLELLSMLFDALDSGEINLPARDGNVAAGVDRTTRRRNVSSGCTFVTDATRPQVTP